MGTVDVSVIVTVLNEKRSVCGLLDTLANQTLRPDQVVICDGGSTDGTVEAIRDAAAAYGEALGEVDLFVLPGANISRGRNAAIARARGPLIAATDAGVRLDEHWLERITEPWQGVENDVGVSSPLAAGGFFVPEAHTVFETAMAATVLPAVEDIDAASFLPSSRSVAFLKSTWERAGEYPEWLDYCEDLIFDIRVNALAPPGENGFAWCPDAIVHFRPRSSLGAFWRQYYRYARGDGKADLWRKRHTIRYTTYVVVLPLVLALATRGGFGRVFGLIALVVGGTAYCWRPWRRLARIGGGLTPTQFAAAVALTPIIRAVGDCAKMAGYPVGLYWRWKNRHRPEIRWRDGIKT
jgi:glycosyltransferase involved in cell wall biosynthesis